MPPLHKLLSTATLLLSLGSPHIPGAQAACYNKCSGKGTCDIYGRCSCHQGFRGADCSIRSCPVGTAFSDEATADDTAHAEVECSGRGTCDTETGTCTCMGGFTGSACERTSCNANCNERGRCVSMSEFASTTRNDNSVQYTYSSIWDAEKIYGCICDDGFSGHDCAIFECADGDDPMTTGQVNEVQLMKCTADPAGGGTFALYYEGKVSTTVSAAATAAQVETAIESIVGIGDVSVTFLPDGAAASACQLTTVNVIKVEFLENFGSLRPLVAYTDALLPVGSTFDIAADGTSTIVDSNGDSYFSVKGTKEAGICANRGMCDTSSGSCSCYTDNGDIFQSSNGQGAAGTRGDCGYAAASITACPGETSCSGHGTCATDGTYVCSCSDGWTGGNCNERLCPYGNSWFQYPTANEVAHDTSVECSNKGSCDRSTGLCECMSGFFGDACQYMACGGGTSNPCSGHGRCLSMRQLSWESNDNGDATDYVYGTDPNNFATWDADRIFGCHCDDDWEGYDCSMRVCPIGDNPGTYGDVREVQQIRCQATSGSFRLQFRQETTAAIDSHATWYELESALEALTTIDNIELYYTRNMVTYSTNTTYQALTTCGTLPCEVLNPGTSVGTLSSGGTFEICSAACDADASCNSFTIDGDACSYHSDVLNATSFSQTSTTAAQSYWITSDPLLIKGVNKIGLCTNSTQENVAVITFNAPTGDVPPIVLYSNSLSLDDDANTAATGIVSIVTTVTGTTDGETCSGRGTCNLELGTCKCHVGWGSSDGNGNMGGLNDCGFRQDPVSITSE